MRGPVCSGTGGRSEENKLISKQLFLQPEILPCRVILLAGGESQQALLTFVNTQICQFEREDTWSSKG